MFSLIDSHYTDYCVNIQKDARFSNLSAAHIANMLKVHLQNIGHAVRVQANPDTSIYLLYVEDMLVLSVSDTDKFTNVKSPSFANIELLDNINVTYKLYQATVRSTVKGNVSQAANNELLYNKVVNAFADQFSRSGKPITFAKNTDSLSTSIFRHGNHRLLFKILACPDTGHVFLDITMRPEVHLRSYFTGLSPEMMLEEIQDLRHIISTPRISDAPMAGTIATPQKLNFHPLTNGLNSLAPHLKKLDDLTVLVQAVQMIKDSASLDDIDQLFTNVD